MKTVKIRKMEKFRRTSPKRINLLHSNPFTAWKRWESKHDETYERADPYNVEREY